jgi:hypothetical protein
MKDGILKVAFPTMVQQVYKETADTSYWPLKIILICWFTMDDAIKLIYKTRTEADKYVRIIQDAEILLVGTGRSQRHIHTCLVRHSCCRLNTFCALEYEPVLVCVEVSMSWTTSVFDTQLQRGEQQQRCCAQRIPILDATRSSKQHMPLEKLLTRN